MVEPPEAENPNSLPQERIDDIANVLATIVRTSIDKDRKSKFNRRSNRTKNCCFSSTI